MSRKWRGCLVFVWTEQFGLHLIDLSFFKLQLRLQWLNLHTHIIMSSTLHCEDMCCAFLFSSSPSCWALSHGRFALSVSESPGGSGSAFQSPSPAEMLSGNLSGHGSLRSSTRFHPLPPSASITYMSSHIKQKSCCTPTLNILSDWIVERQESFRRINLKTLAVAFGQSLLLYKNWSTTK